jgi:hypothetical protein
VSAFPWLAVVIGGPILLGLALAYAKLRTGKLDREIDPNHSADDPAQGMGPKN